MKRVALGRQQEHKSILQNPVRATVNAGEITGVGTTKDKTSLELDVKYCSCTRTYYLCPRKPQSFTHLHKNVNREIDYTQYSIHEGLKLFKEAGVEVVTKEMQQFEYMDILDPKHPEELSKEENQ